MWRGHLKSPGDENHWDWKWAEAIFTKGPVAACYTHGDTSGKWRHRYRAVMELLAKRNEAPCNVAIILDCGGLGGGGGVAALDTNTCGLWCLKISREISVESKILLLVSHACGACGSNQQSQIDCCSWYGRRERIEDLTVAVDGWWFFSFLFFLLCFQLCVVLYKRNYFSYLYCVRELLRRRKTQPAFIKLFFLHIILLRN